jgi:hypothetical protein
MQRENWSAWKALLKEHGPFDMAFHLGDAMDGKGRRSGGTELITSDMDEQADMAAEVCHAVRQHGNRGFKWFGVNGTPYHTTSDGGEDWDTIMAQRAGFEKFGAHEWIDVNGCIFDLKHKVASSTIPHGKFTSIAKSKLWNTLWRDGQPQANVLLRGHVHYHTHCGEPGWIAMTLPALQAAGTKYGSRQCEAIVHWGITVFEVDNKGQFSWTCDTIQFKAQAARAVKA